VDRAPASDQFDREQKAPIQISAVGRDCIDLGTRVGRYDIAVLRGMARGTEIDPDDLSNLASPFALDAQNSFSDLERKVVTPVLDQWPEDRDVESRGLLRDRQLGDRPLVVDRKHFLHERMFAYAPDGNRVRGRNPSWGAVISR
jgi:hypothetical protein